MTHPADLVKTEDLEAAANAALLDLLKTCPNEQVRLHAIEFVLKQ